MEATVTTGPAAVEDDGPEALEGGLDTDTPPDVDGHAAYVATEPTADDKANAEVVYQSLTKADITGTDVVVSGLIAMLDVHPKFTVPEEWPGKEDAEYHQAGVLTAMTAILIRGCPRLTVKAKDVVLLWRNKEKWTAGGKTVRGNVTSFPTRVRHLLKGKLAAVEMNFHHWRTLNPLQRVFALYHELRYLSDEGGIQKPDFHGFFDEVELFGPRVFRDMVELARVVEVGSEVEHPHQLALFSDES